MHSSGLRHRAPPRLLPPASCLRVASLHCGPPPSGSSYKPFTHLFCSWKLASLTFQEASWRHQTVSSGSTTTRLSARANTNVPHSGKAIIPIHLLHYDDLNCLYVYAIYICKVSKSSIIQKSRTKFWKDSLVSQACHWTPLGMTNTNSLWCTFQKVPTWSCVISHITD